MESSDFKCTEVNVPNAIVNLLEPDVLAGKVVKITDGDTLYVLDANYKEHKIRLAGIDAPERKQAYRLASRNNDCHNLLNNWRRGRSLSPIHGLRDTCTSMCNGILTSSHPSYHRTIQQWSQGTTVEWLAEREGFEPPDGCPSTVFKTAAFNHSATSPT